MRQEYIDELTALKTKMEKAEAFAERLPVFAEHILEYKITGEEDWLKFGDRYKKIPLNWGICRGLYLNGATRKIMNKYTPFKDGHYFSIYINSCSLFDGHNLFDLYKSFDGVEIYHIDSMNSTFYLTDENIEPFLEKLNDWYIRACEQLKEVKEKERIEKLEKELTELKARHA